MATGPTEAGSFDRRALVAISAEKLGAFGVAGPTPGAPSPVAYHFSSHVIACDLMTQRYPTPRIATEKENFISIFIIVLLVPAYRTLIGISHRSG